MKGFDCNVKLSYDKAVAMKKSGFDFALRYVGRLSMASNDIDTKETQDILNGGLGLGIVQHCPLPGWAPDGATGTLWGGNAAKFAHAAGVKAGTMLALDLEGIKQGTPHQSIIDYANNWYVACEDGGYLPVLYVGYNAWLTGDELYNKLKFSHYWKSLSDVPDVTTRGYEMVQVNGGVVNGIPIDIDTVIIDHKGNQPVFMKATVTPAPTPAPAKKLMHTIKVYSDGSIETV